MRFDARVKTSAFLLALAAGVFTLMKTQPAVAATAAAPCLVFVGTYTGAKSQGIYAYRFDPASGDIMSLGLAAATENPSFLAVARDGRFLYAVNEISRFQGKDAGAVTAFALDRATGRLSQLNQVSTIGSGPCFLTLNRAGTFVFAANYGSGSVVVLPVRADGSLGEPTAFDQHHGGSVNRQRQAGPHAHGATLSPDERLLFVPDLGLDELVTYRFHAADGTLSPAEPPFAPVAAGAGPRHFIFRRNGKQAYVICEMASTVTEFAFDKKHSRLVEKQTVSTLPDDFTGKSTAAEVALHPNSRFLYASNRGDDSLAVFAVGRRGGLRLIERVPAGGRTPRHFAIDPTGRWLWVANQDSDNIVLFRLDPRTGRLQPDGRKLDLGAPVCVRFVRADRAKS